MDVGVFFGLLLCSKTVVRLSIFRTLNILKMIELIL